MNLKQSRQDIPDMRFNYSTVTVSFQWTHFNSIDYWGHTSIPNDISKCIQPHDKFDLIHSTTIYNHNQYSVKTYIWLTVKCVYPEYRMRMSLSATVTGIKRYTEGDVDYVIRMIHHSLIDRYTQKLMSSWVSNNREY